MSNRNSTTRPEPDEFDASLQSIMERLRKQAAEIEQLRRDLDLVRSSTPIVTPPNGVPKVDSETETSKGRSPTQ